MQETEVDVRDTPKTKSRSIVCMADHAGQVHRR
jgi:hypothetical protein